MIPPTMARAAQVSVPASSAVAPSESARIAASTDNASLSPAPIGVKPSAREAGS